MTTLSKRIEEALTTSPLLAEAADWMLPEGQELETKLLPAPVLEALRGKALGHPLHPVLIHLPLGGWMLTALLDHWQGGDEQTERAADLVLLASTLGAVPTVAAGWTDWTWNPMTRQARRTGALHGLLEESALFLNAASLISRNRGKRGLGKALSGAGLGLALLGGMLGGELVYGHGVGVGRRGRYS